MCREGQLYSLVVRSLCVQAVLCFKSIRAANQSHNGDGQVSDHIVCEASASRGDHSEAPSCIVGLV